MMVKDDPQFWLDVAHNLVRQGKEEDEQLCRGVWRVGDLQSWGCPLDVSQGTQALSDIGFNPCALETTSFYLPKPHQQNSN